MSDLAMDEDRPFMPSFALCNPDPNSIRVETWVFAAEKLEPEFGDLQNLLGARGLKLKKLIVGGDPKVCKHANVNKLIADAVNDNQNDVDVDEIFSFLQPLDLLTNDVYQLKQIVKEKRKINSKLQRSLPRNKKNKLHLQ